MSIFFQVVATIMWSFWFPLYIAFIMGLGAPGATNDLKSIRAMRAALYYPSVIAFMFWLFGGSYLGIKGHYLFFIVTGLNIVVIDAIGYNKLISNLKKGIKNSGYSVVQNAVYYDAVKIEAADAQSFYVFENDEIRYSFRGLAKDKQHVYYNGEIIEQADPQTLEFVRYPDGRIADAYLKDKNVVFYYRKVLVDADPGTFEVYNRICFDGDIYFARDKNTVWLSGEPLKGVDASSFKVLTYNDSYTNYFSAKSTESGESIYYWRSNLIHHSKNSAGKMLDHNTFLVDGLTFIDGEQKQEGETA